MLPTVTEELLLALEAAFRRPESDWQTPVRQLDFQAGQQSVLKRLRAEFERQTDPNRSSLNVLRTKDPSAGHPTAAPAAGPHPKPRK